MVNTTEEKQPNGEYNNPNHPVNYINFPPLVQQQKGQNKDQPTITTGTPMGESDAIEAHFQRKLDKMKAEMRGEMKSMQ
eukprot:2194374-Ditylum_brightwellii.AAC.1